MIFENGAYVRIVKARWLPSEREGQIGRIVGKVEDFRRNGEQKGSDANWNAYRSYFVKFEDGFPYIVLEKDMEPAGEKYGFCDADAAFSIVKRNGKTEAIVYEKGTLRKTSVRDAEKDDSIEAIISNIKSLFERKYSARIVCVNKGTATCFTEGKIYQVEDSVLTDDNGDTLDEMRSIDCINERMKESDIRFIEIKE